MRTVFLLVASILLTHPGRAQWQALNVTNVGSAARTHIHGSTLFYYDSDYLRSTDGGTTWTDFESAFPSGADVEGIFTHDGGLYALGKTGIYGSADEGVTWTGLIGFPIPRGGTLNGFSSDGPRLYLHTDRNLVFYSDDGAATFTQASVPLGGFNMVDFAAVGSTWVAVIGNGGVTMSFDAGQTWPTGAGNIWKVFAHGDAVYGMTFINGLHRIRAGETGFVELSNGLDQAGRSKSWESVVSQGTALIARGMAYPGSAQEIYLSLDQGDTWSALDLTGLPAINAAAQEMAMFAANDQLLVANYQRNVPANIGLFSFSLPTSTTVSAPELPDSDLLLEAYPNPFSQGVTISLSGVDKLAWTIGVFDLQGRLVTNLQTDSSGRAWWDGRGADGTAVPAGVYLISGEGGVGGALIHRLTR